MDLSPRSQRRLLVLVREPGFLRAALCLVFMLMLVWSDLTLWLALPLPILTYVGLSLVFARESKPGQTEQPPADHRPRLPSVEERQLFEACVNLHVDLTALTSRVVDPVILDRLKSINVTIPKILMVIEQDDKWEAARSLRRLLGDTKEYLALYVKTVVERGFDDADSVKLLQSNFMGLARKFDLFWIELNQEGVLNLKSLGEILKEEVDEGDLPYTPRETGSGVDNDTVSVAAVFEAAAGVASASTDVLSLNGVYLTSREYEVLVLLVNGLTAQQMGLELGISPRTAEKNVQTIREKFGVESSTQAAVYAVLHGIVKPDQISFGQVNCDGADST